MSEFSRRDGENEREYIWRIGQAVDDGKILSWQDAANLINSEWREDETDYRDESAYRKPYTYSKKFYEDVFRKFAGDDYSNKIKEQTEALTKERMKLMDQRREFNNGLRKEARNEHLMEVIEESVAKVNSEFPLLEFKDDGTKACDGDVEKEAILCFSDWHYGMVTNNIWNEYNVDICKERVAYVVRRCSEYLKLHGVKKLHVVLLGDAAHGAIHTSCRVASEENVSDQLIHVSELIAEAVDNLSKYVDRVYVYSTYGNHMRTIQNKEDSAHDDNMEKIIPWYLSARFGRRPDIFVVDADYYEFIRLTVAGYNVCCTHGDLDSFKNLGVTVNTIFTKKYGDAIDYTFSADKHHLEEFEQFGIESVLVRSLCGTDAYANDRRLYSEAGQSLFIFDPRYGREATYNIKC